MDYRVSYNNNGGVTYW